MTTMTRGHDCMGRRWGFRGRRILAFASSFAVFLACHPYGDALRGEFNAGSADPFNFPPPFRGTGFTREVAGSGNFTEIAAFANGAPANYFLFPFPPSVVTTTGYAPAPASADPLRIAGPSALPTPAAYAFDPPPPPATVPARANCTPPAGYVYDAFRDDVHYDDQGNIFSALPNANFAVGGLPTWSYIPVVKQVTAVSAGEGCQSIKSEATLQASSSVQLAATSPAQYLAWAIIDPGASVFRVGQTARNSNGISVQHWGWYNQFLVAYIDGGIAPTVPDSTNPAIVRLQTQRLFYPRSGAPARPAGAPSGNALGTGNDVLEFPRGDPNYTPVCQVLTYALPAGTPVPTDAATILANTGPGQPFGALTPPPAPATAGGAITPSFVFCLQAQ